MTTLGIIVINLITAVLSTLFGYFALPYIIDFLVLKTKFNAFRAMYIAKRAQRKKRKAFERSSAYSKRLAEILKLIRETSASAEEKSIKIAYLDECETDHEIMKELQRRGFDTWYNEENTLKISW